MKLTDKSHYFFSHLFIVFNFVFILLLMTNLNLGMAQSRSAIGLRYGINKPYADAYKFGTGGAIQLNLALNKKWGFDASFNYDRINGDKSVFNSADGPVSFLEANSLNLVHIDLAMRYYVIPDFFARFGPIIYFAGGNEDLAGLGIGGTAAIGYQLMLDKRNKLEFVFNTDVVNVQYGTGVTPIAGLKVTYAFNFSRH